MARQRRPEVSKGMFIGGLKPKLSKKTCMFKPRTLKETISLASIKDVQLSK